MDARREDWLTAMRADERAFLAFLEETGKLKLGGDDQDRLDELRFRPLFGEVALRERVLKVDQIAQVLATQAGTTKRFGALAVELGFLSEADVEHLLELQRRLRPPLSWVLVESGLLSATKLWRERIRFEDAVGSTGVVR
ncbi:MAG: hypothetical protein AAGH15_05885 [Myxococcota bacterium]